MTARTYALLGLMLIPPEMLWAGFVFMRLWSWFVVPTLHAPPLALAPAIGIALVIAYCTHQARRSCADEKRDRLAEFAEATFLSLARPALFLGLGWIVKAFL